MTILSKFFFPVVFESLYFLNMLLPRKPQDFAEKSSFFICLFSLSWNSDSKNSFATCPQEGDFWGAFDLPESESGFEIMILIHRFI